MPNSLVIAGEFGPFYDEVHEFMRANLCMAFGATLFLCSCSGGGGDYKGPVGQVTGVVNLGDSPLKESATLTFLSKEGHAVSATLSGDGEYRMKFNSSNNIPVGSYRVAVVPNLPEESNTKKDPASFFNPDGTTKKTTLVTSKIPEKYRQTGTSGLDLVVKEGKQTLNIDLDLK